ncbi:MAG: 4-alpha-glucanotransferase [Myxococcota bacterium]
MLGYRVLPFEKHHQSIARSIENPNTGIALVVACVTTHDTATLRAFWERADIALRHKHGLLDEAGQLNALKERDSDLQGLNTLLQQEGLLPTDQPVGFCRILCRRTSTGVARTPPS